MTCADAEEVASQLKNSQKQEASLRKQLTEREEQVQKLEQELRLQKKRHLDEVRNVNQTINDLQAQVEAKSNNIAFLTTELHRLKVHHKSNQSLLQSNTAVVGEVGASIVRRIQPQYNHLPVPPKDIVANSTRIRPRGSHLVGSSSVRHRVVKVSNNSGGGEGEILSRAFQVASTSTPSSGSQSPDVAPFLQKNADFGVELKKPPVLPPIPVSVSSPPDQQVEMHHMLISQTGSHRVSKGRPCTPEVATLAVDQVGDKNWNRAHESRSSEYN